MLSRWMLVAAATGLTACSSGMDTTPVSVSVVVSPAANAAAVSRSAPITMDAGMSMDPSSCSGRMLLHLGDSTGPLVPAHITWGDSNRRMVLQPDAMLAPMTTYFVHVRDSMMTSSNGGMMTGGMSNMRRMMFDQPPVGGMRMGDGMAWTFTTGP